MKRTRYFRVPVDQLVPRSMRPDGVRYARQVWLHQARLGHRMPVEKGVILLKFPYKEGKDDG